MRFTIRKKLMSGFLVVVILLGLVSVVSIYNFKKLDTSYSDLINRREVILSNSKDMRSDIIQQMSSLRDYLLTQNDDGLARFNSAYQDLTESINSTLQLVHRDGDKDTLYNLSEYSNRFKESADQALILAKTNQEASMKLVNADVIPMGREMEEMVNNIVDGQQQLVGEGNRENTLMVSSIRTTVVFISIVSVIVSIVIAFFISRMISRPVILIANEAKRIASGDLTSTNVIVKNRDEVGEMADSFNQMANNLRSLIVQVSSNIEHVAASSEELTASAEQTNKATEHIAYAIQEVANGTDKQVHSVLESSSSVNEMSAGAQQIAANAHTVSFLAAESADKSLEGTKAIHSAVDQMNSIQYTMNGLSEVIEGLGQRLQHIGTILELITSISSQTNLLALNASIEAARAGAHGRGFAVVASEIRKLSEQSSQASQEIGEYIATIQQETNVAVQSMESGTIEVTEGIRVVGLAGVSFEQIHQSVHQVATQIQDVAAAAQQMSANTEHVVSSMNYISKVAKEAASGTQDVSSATEEQLASMEEIEASSTSLSKMAEELRDVIGKFKV